MKNVKLCAVALLVPVCTLICCLPESEAFTGNMDYLNRIGCETETRTGDQRLFLMQARQFADHEPAPAALSTRESVLSARRDGRRNGTITWTYEDWDGAYGAIADSFAVPADGSRVYTGWYLNYERIAAFDAQGNGVPLWEYDLRESGKYYVGGSVQVVVSDDGSVLAGSVTNRELIGGNTVESFVSGLDINTGDEIWRYTPPLTAHNQDATERIGPITIAADGSRIAVVSYGYRQDPVFEPVFITILDSDGQELHRIEITDSDGDISYLNDLKFATDASFLAADFRMRQNPTHTVTVWDMTDHSEYTSWTVMNSPPQGQMGLSADGSILAIGDLRGKLRVYERDTASSEYFELWSYTVPPDYYIPWVVGLDVSRDGNWVAAGSYQATENDPNGYVYLFNVNEGPESLVKSSNFGGMVHSVQFSADSRIVAGAGYGPYPETLPGYDLVVINTETGYEVYRMPGNTPGSLMGCALNADGTRLAAGGKRVHAYEFGSGGYAYSIALTTDPEPTPTPEHTPTPAETPTPESTPTPEPTPECDSPGCTIDIPSQMFHAGDICYCNVIVCNPTDESFSTIPLFVILDVYGILFFAPEFSEFSYYLQEFKHGETVVQILPPFEWPENAGQAHGIYWYAGMTNPGMTELFGEMDVKSFGWE